MPFLTILGGLCTGGIPPPLKSNRITPVITTCELRVTGSCLPTEFSAHLMPESNVSNKDGSIVSFLTGVSSMVGSAWSRVGKWLAIAISAETDKVPEIQGYP